MSCSKNILAHVYVHAMRIHFKVAKVTLFSHVGKSASYF